MNDERYRDIVRRVLDGDTDSDKNIDDLKALVMKTISEQDERIERLTNRLDALDATITANASTMRTLLDACVRWMEGKS